MAVTINYYQSFIEYQGDNTIDLDGDTFKAELYNSSHVFTATHTQRSDISANALATGSGYTNPGQNLASVTWAHSGANTDFDAADVTWSASGGSIAADDCVIYDDTTTVPVDALMCSIDFGGTQTAGDGTNFLITFNATGIFRIVT